MACREHRGCGTRWPMYRNAGVRVQPPRERKGDRALVPRVRAHDRRRMPPRPLGHGRYVPYQLSAGCPLRESRAVGLRKALTKPRAVHLRCLPSHRSIMCGCGQSARHGPSRGALAPRGWLARVGDILVLLQVLDAKHKDWVKRLLIPYYIFSAIAAVVSLAALLSKLSLLVSKFKRRSIGRHRPHSQDVAHLLRGADKDRVQLAEKFDRSGPVALPSARLFAGVAVRCSRVRFHGRKTSPNKARQVHVCLASSVLLPRRRLV